MMKSGDTCEIFTSKVESAGPSRDWLQFVESPRARNKIKQWFSRERREDMVETGRDELTKEFRREALAHPADVDERRVVAGDRGGLVQPTSTRCWRRSAKGMSRPARSRRRWRARSAPATTPSSCPRLCSPRPHGGPRRPRNAAGVHVEGLDDVLVRLSRCCTPVPGDDIVGFVTRGRGVSVHRTRLCQRREPDVRAGGAPDRCRVGRRAVARPCSAPAVEVVALDRSRLLRDVANSLSEQHVNIVSCSTHTGSDRVAKMRFEFEMADPSHLESRAAHDQTDRRRLRRLPPRARQRAAPQVHATCASPVRRPLRLGGAAG